MSQWWRRVSLAARARVPFSLPAFKRLEAAATFRGTLSGEAAARFERLSERYDVSSWEGVCNHQDWVESAYVLDVLDQVMPRALPPGRALDIGSKNGAYVPGVATGLARACDFVELDAHRRYLWGSTRRVYGERMAAAFEGSRFHAADVKTLVGPWSVVTWFLPFLTAAPVDAWDLPLEVLEPAALVAHVWSYLAPGGVMLIVNQGDHEAARQRELLEAAALGPRTQSLGRIVSPLSPFRRERYGVLVRKPA